MKNGILFLFILFALLINNSANANTSADSTAIIRCISVLPDSTITITWSQPLDTNGFNAYMIYRKSTTIGSYVLQDSIFSFNTVIYNDANVNAYGIFNSYSYFVKVRSIVGGDTIYSIASDSIQPIMVHVADIGTNGVGIASINWNEIHTPPLSSSAGKYFIYRMDNYPTGSWVLIDSTTNLFYHQPATFCSRWLGYRVEIADTVCKCISTSGIGKALFYDYTPPAIVQIDSVSIDPITGNIIVGWAPDSSLDTRGYTIVQRINHNYWTHIDTTLGRFNTFYNSHFSSSPVDSFFILAVDSCNNQSSQGAIQSTIHVDMSIDTCGQSVVLNWNPYIGWVDGVKKYYILLKIGAGPYTVIDSVADSVNTYTYSQLTQFSTFRFRIRALDNNGHFTSSSNVGLVDIILHNFPHWGYIKTATVLTNSKIELDLYTDTTAQVVRYNIQQTTDTAAGWTTIGWTGKYSYSQFSYIDSTVDANTNPYFYRFQALDSCEIVVFTSNIAHPILVHATANPDFSNTITWTPYSGFQGGDSIYYLYRSVDGVLNPNPIARLPFGKNTYVDTITHFGNSQGEFCYKVKQLEARLDTFKFKDSTFSNSSCAEQSPSFYIPNAFTPNGKNPIFIPSTLFTNIHLYDLNIYDRLGELIFETNDPLKGWDGTYKGNMVPTGVYIYTIIITGQDDTQTKQLGSVTVLR